MMKIHRLFLSIALALAAVAPAMSQSVGVRSNLLSDIALSPNIGAQIGLAPRWTFNVSGQLNLWTIDEHKWKHWLVQPEGRYWFCRAFAGHFVGLHAIGGQYNFGNINFDVNFLGSDFSQLRHKRYQGWGAGAGVAYGYAWPIARRWNIEAEIGLGWIYTRYDVYPCADCGRKLEENRVHNYVGPTKLAINIEYLF